MQDEPEVQPEEPTPEVEPEQPEEGTAEPTEVEEVSEQPEEAPETPEVAPYILRTTIDGEEREFDLNDEDVRKEVTERLSKGYDYTKKLQRIAEMEKANEGWVTLGKTVANDPLFLKASIAQQMGIDPSVLYTKPTQPPDWLKADNPEAYADAMALFKQNAMAVQVVEQAAQQYTHTMAQQNNQLLFEKARLKFDLTPSEFAQMTDYVGRKIQPNRNGMYDDSDVTNAYWALFGEKKAGEKRLETSENIRKTIQTASREQGPKKPISGKRERLTKQERDDRDFLDYVRSVSQ